MGKIVNLTAAKERLRAEVLEEVRSEVYADGVRDGVNLLLRRIKDAMALTGDLRAACTMVAEVGPGGILDEALREVAGWGT